MSWNARAWVAGILGCDVEELSIKSQGTGQVHYQDSAGTEVAWLVVAGPISTLDGTPGGRHEIMLRLPNGTFHRPEEVVPDTANIEF